MQSRVFLSQCSDTGDESGFFISNSEGTTSYLHHQLFLLISDYFCPLNNVELTCLADRNTYLTNLLADHMSAVR
jgi:hypothetical protein